MIDYIRPIVAASAALIVISCVKEIPQNEQAASGAVLTFSSEYEDASQTKTHWNGEEILWTASDKIAVTYKDKGVWSGKLFNSDPLSKETKSAVFTVPTDLENGYNGTLDFYAVYPQSIAEGFASEGQLKVKIPTTQTPLEDTFHRFSDLMYGYSVEHVKQVSDQPVSLFWRRLVAHVDVTVVLPDIRQGETVKTISFQTDAAITGTYILDMGSGTLTTESANNTVIAKCDNLSADQGQMKVWLSVHPGMVKSLKVILKTEKATYTKTISSCELDFEVNTRNRLRVDMSAVERIPMTDATRNALINERLFSLINLDAPGLEEVKYLYSYGCLYEAAEALRAYYRTRTDVKVPLVDLSSTSYTQSQQYIADQALKENGYRFYIAANYMESTSPDVYYSFLDTDEGVNWEYRPSTEDMFMQHLYRHPWVATQALVYWGTKNEKYVKGIVDVYTDWLKTYPCPVAGKDSYKFDSMNLDYRRWCQLQACARIETYIKVIEYCKGAESFTPEFLSDLLVSLYDCTECIRANYYYTGTGNIRQAETKGVLNMAVMLPEFNKSQEWFDEAVADTDRMLDLLIMDDGVLVEKDVSYHLTVVNNFYDTHHLLSVNDRLSALPSDFISSLRGAVTFVRDIMYPNYSMEDFNDTRTSSWTKSVLTKNFIRYSEMFPEDQTLQWFATDRNSGSAPTELLSEYKSAGYYMLRSGWMPSDMMLILKNNENSGGFAHCQNDNGTISLYRNGRKFLPDAGVYTYGGSDAEDALRDQFRQTKMHNTLTYNGQNSVSTLKDKTTGAELCGIYKKSVQNDIYDMVHVSNQSYGALRHERIVYRMKDGFFVVVDLGLGSATGNIELNWHMAPGTIKYVTQSDSFEARTAFSDGNNMSFRTFCFNNLTLNKGYTLTKGTSWHSDLPGRRYERQCYTLTQNMAIKDNPARFVTVIYPFASESEIPQMSAVFNSASSITVTVGEKGYQLSL